MIPLYKPYMPSSLPEADKILHSGQLAYGKYGRLFEDSLREYISADYLVTASTYTSAVIVALLASGIRAGDEVIASPMSCLASTQPFAVLGIKIVWSDIDPSRGTLDPDCVRKLISGRTKAIVHNHFCGYPGHVDAVNAIGKQNGVLVIDDCIEAFGSENKQKMLGNTGADISVFSFQAVRLPSTLDGGAVVFRDKSIYERSILARDSGIDRRYFRDSAGEISPDCDIVLPGLGATMNELSSYIGLLSMNDIGGLLERQRLNAKSWTSWLSKMRPGIKPLHTDADINPNYWVYGMLAKNKVDAIDEFRKLGFYASGVHLPNNFYSLFGEKAQLPGIEDFYSRYLAVPSGWWTDISEVLNV